MKSKNGQRGTALSFLDVVHGGLCRVTNPDEDRVSVLLEDAKISQALRLGDILHIRLTETASPARGMRRLEFPKELKFAQVEAALCLERGFLEVLYDYDFQKVSVHMPLSSQLSALRKTLWWPESDFVKNAKYRTAYPMAAFLKNDLPPAPCPSYSKGGVATYGDRLLFEGPMKRFLKARINSHTTRNARLMMGILQGVKRAAAVVGPSFVLGTMLSHKAALSKAEVSDVERDPIHHGYHARFWEEFKSRAPRVCEPSGSASIESPRSCGGGRGFLQRLYAGCQSITGAKGTPLRHENTNSLFGEFPWLAPLPPQEQSSRKPDLPMMKEELELMYESRPGKVHEVRVLPFFRSFAEEVRFTRAETDAVASARINCLRPGRVPLKVGPSPSTIPPPEAVMARVAAILEPLKCRLITKGEAIPYHLAKSCQKDMWSHLQQFPQLSLTGCPLMEHDLHLLLQRTRKIGLTHFRMWVSGDYSAATDKIRLSFTRSAFESMLARSHYGAETKAILRSVIYEHQVSYPKEMVELAKKKGQDLSPFLQVNGQLMGSPLSFPILCCVNLCCYWMTLEQYLGHEVLMSDLPVLVNGDDILFMADDEFYGLWKSNVRTAGFELSQGKNYIHPEFLMVNSQGFLHKRSNGRDVFEPVDYLNVGLLTGQSKLAGRADQRLAPIWDYYNPVIRGAMDPVRAHRRFMHYHREAIDKFTLHGEYSLFIHQAFGGLGFFAHPQVVRFQRFTPFQRKFGNFLRETLRQEVDGEFSMPSLFRGIVNPPVKLAPALRRYHFGHYKTRPLLEPRRAGEVEVMNPEIALGLSAATNVWPTDSAEIPTVRPPDKGVKRDFRSRVCRDDHLSKLLEIDFLFVEDKSRVCGEE